MSSVRVSLTPVRRRSASVVTASVLAISGLAFTASAQAVDSPTIVTKSDIAPDETTYAGWHEGSGNPGSYDVTSDGLVLEGRSQVIKGYDNNSKTLDVKNAVLGSTLDAASYDVVSGDVAFQVPIFFTSETASTPKFTTLYPDAPAVIGENDVDLTDQWVSTKQISNTIEAGTAYPLSEIIAAIDDYKTLGFGVFTGPGQTATVSDLTWAGTTYEFKPGAPQAVNVTNADVDGYEDGNYNRWHQGYANADARQQVSADGLVLSPESQVIKGYDNNSNTIDTKNINLTNHLNEASYSVSEGTAFFQIPLFFDNGAGVKFATLRNEGTDGNLSLDDNWQSSKTIGAINADTPTKLSDIIAALGDYKVIGFGVVSSVNATVENITFDGTSYSFEDGPASTVAETVLESDIKPDESVYNAWHQGYTTGVIGTNEVHNDGLVLEGRSQVIKGYDNNTSVLDGKNIRLEDAVSRAAYTVTAGDAFFQIPMLAKDGANPAKFLTLRPAVAAGVGDHAIKVSDQWVSSKSLGSIVADQSYPLSTIIDSFKDYKVLGFGVLSNVGDSASVSDITWDGTKYSFVNHAPTAANLTGATPIGTAVTVTLLGADSDGNTLTYGATGANGTANVVGNQLTYTPATGFAGASSLTYTVNDNRGGTATATATINVAKAASKTTFTINPKAPTKKSKVKAYVKVTSNGAVLKWGIVRIYDGKKKVGNARLLADGTAVIKFTKKLKKGTHKLKVVFAGTDTSNTSTSKTLTVKVKK